MDEKLIADLKKLNQIKPGKEFILSTKKQILGEEPGFAWFPMLKPVYAGIFALFLMFGVVKMSQSALPGEILFRVKKLVEKGEIALNPQERPRLNLLLTNKRLGDLLEVAQDNGGKKLVSAMDEFRARAAEAAESLQSVTEINEEIVLQAKQLEENKEKIEEVLATKIETEELDNALSQLIEREIKDLEQRTLNEEELEILEQTKEFFENAQYSDALVKILELNQK